MRRVRFSVVCRASNLEFFQRIASRYFDATPTELSKSAPVAPPPRDPSDTLLPLSDGLSVCAFMDRTQPPIAEGTITSRIAASIYAVRFDKVPLASPVVELGSKVTVRIGNAVTSGLVAKVHGNGSSAVLLDNDKFEPDVPHDQIVSSEGLPNFRNLRQFTKMQEWIRAAGVEKRSDNEATACILFQRGWRVEKLYLLEASDVHCLSHLNKSVRMGLLEKAQWELDELRNRREVEKEKWKEQDTKYWVLKYSGVAGTIISMVAVCLIFYWNYKNWFRQTREFQKSIAVQKMLDFGEHFSAFFNDGEGSIIPRETEVNEVVGILQRSDVMHRRILIITGPKAGGKSVLIRLAAMKAGVPAVMAELRGTEDPLRAIAKALDVTNAETCGDLAHFVSDVLLTAKSKDMKRSGKNRASSSSSSSTPVVILRPHGTDIQLAHETAMFLTCERQVANVVIELPIEKLDPSIFLLPRVDFFYFPPFSPEEAAAYVGEKVEKSVLTAFVQACGTDINSLDELISAVYISRRDPVQFTQTKIQQAAKVVRSATRGKGGDKLLEFLRALCNSPDGAGGGLSDTEHIQSLGLHEKLPGIVWHNFETDRWEFTSPVYRSAVAIL